MNTNKFMRIIVFFDLPVTTKKQRHEATKFRNFLLKDGYHMIQFSIYARICNGYENVSTHEQRISANLPSNGSVRLLIITEKQYDAIRILVGPKDSPEIDPTPEQISFF